MELNALSYSHNTHNIVVQQQDPVLTQFIGFTKIGILNKNFI